MNMYRVEERKKCLKQGIRESSFNLTYLKDKTLENPTFISFSEIILYENDIIFLMNT